MLWQYDKQTKHHVKASVYNKTLPQNITLELWSKNRQIDISVDGVDESRTDGADDVWVEKLVRIKVSLEIKAVNLPFSPPQH
jgi:hypothetical protein